MDALNALRGISNQYNKIAAGSAASEVRDNSFATIFQSAKDMLEETSNLQNKAEEQEIKFALGLSNNTHDLQIAQEKANIALQYTIAVRDKVIEAYKELMNISV
ncbi:MAG: flagellar hook-basal body complex protein FliE [Lachnospiraceae bacterium]|nr:flagellar hook-basal body complex protein FliE [Lachnospiraceae bacterium]MBR0435481.1 flagellar hook-basal body complex protein FliE [Lachnospiraceae bacterium]